MKIILSILLCLSLASCTVYGVTNDYKKLSDDDRSTIVSLKNFDDTNVKYIYKINGKQLKEELKNIQNLWSTFSQMVAPLNIVFRCQIMKDLRKKTIINFFW